MKATYRLNEEREGVEIAFGEKPPEGVRDALKAQGFHYHRGLKIWYAKQTLDRIAFAKELSDGPPEAQQRDEGLAAMTDVDRQAEDEAARITGR